jgi:hypothetical protein
MSTLSGTENSETAPQAKENVESLNTLTDIQTSALPLALPSIGITPSPNKPQHVPGKRPRTTEPLRILACESCCRLKFKCDNSRPCETCTRRGTACIPRARKTGPCFHCRRRRVRCDLRQPCKGCVDNNRTCSTDPPLVIPGPVIPSRTTITEKPSTPFLNETSFEAESDCRQDAVLDISDPLGLASFQFDEFPSLTPFWPDPRFQAPPA